MKALYGAILEFFGEIEQDTCMDNNITFSLDCAKEMVNSIIVIFWFHICFS